MAIRDLLKAFEGGETLPVDLQAVAAWMREKGFQDEIEFIGVKLDIGVIRGFLHRFRFHRVAYGEHVNVAHIYYGMNQEPEWINMVCAKEIVHIGDGAPPVKRKDELDNLMKRLAMPDELKVLLEDPEYAAADKFGDAFGAAILLPMTARNLLLRPYKDGIITVSDIARMAVMPELYARIVMSDEWETVYAKMVAL